MTLGEHQHQAVQFLAVRNVSERCAIQSRRGHKLHEGEICWRVDAALGLEHVRQHAVELRVTVRSQAPPLVWVGRIAKAHGVDGRVATVGIHVPAHLLQGTQLSRGTAKTIHTTQRAD